MTFSHMKTCSDCFLKKEVPDICAATKSQLLRSRTNRTVNPGQCLLSQDSIATTFYCIAGGQVHAIENDIHGRSSLVFTLKRNGIFPMLALFNKKPTRYGFISAEQTTLCQFPLPLMQDLLAADPGLARLFLQRCCLQTQETYQRLTILQSKDSSEKILETLRQFKDENNLCSMSRQEIATWTNLTIETVIRTLTSLEKKKRIKKVNRDILVY